MARRVRDIAITAEGRDAGKVFRVTEMSASAAEKWAARAFLALARSGIDIPADIAQTGLAGIATLGMRAFGSMSFADAEPLLDEMMGCVSRIVDPAKPIYARALIEDDIEEVATRLQLRLEVWKLHTELFTIAGLSTSGRPNPNPSEASPAS